MSNTEGAFSAWVGPRDAKCVLVGEAFGREEDEKGEPFVGQSGKELWRLLGEAFPDLSSEEHHRVSSFLRFGGSWTRERERWLEEASLAFTNVFNLRPRENKIASLCCKRSELPKGYSFPAIEAGWYMRPEYLREVERLYEELAICRPNLVVALGNKAAWALLRATNISQIRGTTTQATITFSGGRDLELKVLPTWHPAGLLYEGQWQRRPILLADLMKAKREMQFPDLRRPKRQIHVQPSSIEEWELWCENARTVWRPGLLGCDTETSMGMIDTLGFSIDEGLGFACHFRPHRIRRGENYITVFPRRDGREVANYWTEEEEKRFWAAARLLLEGDVPLLFQNGLYDLQYFWRMGLRPKAAREDLMLRHHSLLPGMQKGLGFLGSIYTSEASWKLMRRAADTEKRDE